MHPALGFSLLQLLRKEQNCKARAGRRARRRELQAWTATEHSLMNQNQRSTGPTAQVCLLDC